MRPVCYGSLRTPRRQMTRNGVIGAACSRARPGRPAGATGVQNGQHVGVYARLDGLEGGSNAADPADLS